jgi:hypothetical protein
MRPIERPAGTAIQSAGRINRAALVLGYLGSDNPSNRDALQAFLDSVWPDLHEQSGGDLQLVIGGGLVIRYRFLGGPFTVWGRCNR